MKRFALVSILFVVTVGSLVADDKGSGGLDGNYKTVELLREGKSEPASVVDKMTLKIAGKDLTFTIKDKTFPAKIAIDAKAKPTAIDIAPSDGPEKGRTFLGIYKLDKDELVLAFTEKGERPTEFKSEGDVILIRLKREEKKSEN